MRLLRLATRSRSHLAWPFVRSRRPRASVRISAPVLQRPSAHGSGEGGEDDVSSVGLLLQVVKRMDDVLQTVHVVPAQTEVIL